MQDPMSIDWSTMPAPLDDGAANHLSGRIIPAVALDSTDGGTVDLSRIAGRVVIYVYPWKKHPDGVLPEGWTSIPGAAGCTPQSCAFRDRAAAIEAAGVRHIFGLSTQDTPYQREAVERLHLPYPLLSDRRLELAKALSLPSFTAADMTLLKRLTMIVDDGVIRHVFYPVFPPHLHAGEVLAWLQALAPM
ncbi:peroxiredoxin [Trinickia sp. NRRL B-1857]|uniref:peroxiredoxin n=1 Tax=Trinickia sp. NRRL B-1857 TaxID=3162879 RepID=UPI003D266819